MAQSNKVYLNPKFNDVIKTNMSLQQKNVMHINPLFAFHKQPLQQNAIAPKPRIYVNPNFITNNSNQSFSNIPQYNAVTDKTSFRTNNAITQQKVGAIPANCNISDTFMIRSVTSFGSVPANNIEQNFNSKVNNPTSSQASAPFLTATRYSLVRQNTKKYDKEALVKTTENTAGKLPIKVTNTVKINKFKSVKLEDLKKSFNISRSDDSTFNTKGFPLERHHSKADSINNLVATSQNINTQKKRLSATRSRYCLVRSKNKNDIVSRFLKKPPISTPIRCYKKELNISNGNKHNFKNISLRNKDLTTNQKVVYKIHNRFRIVKENTVLACTSSSSKGRRLSLVSKKIQRSCKTEINKFGKFNKNNIPCPLFRKYGKCIRNINGTCKFLHDKKHVSICRKFLKGVCHDKECLLSHDITSKKMPTCYYYLKGMCTKEDCPYLHVKLNENAKICPDFTRGFCEKGENCLYRHINICPNLVLKGKCASDRCLYPHKVVSNFKTQSNNKVKESGCLKNSVIIIKKTKERILIQGNHDVISTKTEVSEETIDNRYYKDAMSYNPDSEVCENIKPTRVKLGTLPSFIQLKK